LNAQPAITGRTRVPAAAWIVVLLLATAYLLVTAARDFPNQLGQDLYHPWGIGLAREALPPGSNPYRDPVAYGEIAAQAAAAAREASPRLWMAGGVWKSRSEAAFEPTGTPFFYAVMALLPGDYDRAHLLHAVLQFIAVAVSVFALARLRGVPAVPALVLAAAVEIAFSGFVRDVNFANVTSFQLLVVTALVWVSARGLLARHRALEVLYLPLLALFVAYKPNGALVALAMGLHFAVARGPRPTLVGAAAAALALLGAFATAALYFGDAGVWRDWVHYTQGAHGGKLLYSVDAGNQSLAMLMAEKGGAYGPLVNSAIIALGIAVALVVAMSDSGKRPELLAPALRRLFSDPGRAASAGVILTCAAAPLFWHHYYVLCLVPMLWLFGRGNRLASWSVALSGLALSTPLLKLLVGLELYGGAYSTAFFAWVPLLVAVVADARTLAHRETVA
jgi:hypothetical protein